MAEIDVTGIDEGEFRVRVTEGGSSSTHQVTIDSEDLARWTDGQSAVELVQASFRFLLDREPKESILSSFDIGVIERYFPEYPERIGDYL